jgi:predicted small secreted protein
MKMEKLKLFNGWIILLLVITITSCSTYQGVGNTREAAQSQKYSQGRTWPQFNSVR